MSQRSVTVAVLSQAKCRNHSLFICLAINMAPTLALETPNPLLAWYAITTTFITNYAFSIL